MNKKDSVWVDLYNSLYFVSSYSREFKRLESPIFVPLEEFEMAMINSLNEKSLNSFLEEGWIDLAKKQELEKFKRFVEKIDNQFWNINDFDRHEDWAIARKWASSLLKQLGEERRGWDNTGEVIIEY